MRQLNIKPVLASNWRWLVLACVSLSYLLVFTQRTGPGVISDRLQAEFHVSAAVLGTITSIQYLLYMIVQIPIGVYGDKSGPERMLVTGVLLDGIGTLVFTAAPTFAWLLAGRAIVGLGDALIWVNIVLILGKWFGKGRFAAVLGLVTTAGNVGALITSIPLAAWIAVSGWHIPFAMLGILLVAVSVVNFFVLIRGGSAREKAALEATHLKVQHVPLRQMLVETVHSKLAWGAFFCHFGAVGTYLAMVSLWIVPYFMDVYKLSRADAAWFTLTAFLGSVIASPFMGWFSDRIRDRKRPYFVTQSLDVLAWLIVVIWQGQPPLLLSGLVMFIVGFGSGSSLLTFATIRDHVPLTQSGLASGFANTGGFLSAVLLPVLFGVIFDSAGGTTGIANELTRHAYGSAFILPTAFAGLGVIGTLLLPRGLGSTDLA